MAQSSKTTHQTSLEDNAQSAPSSPASGSAAGRLPPFEYTDIKPDTIIKGILSREELEAPKKPKG